MLYDGKGGPKDLIEARKWFSKAANRGNAESIFALVYMLQHGEGGAKDLDEVEYWLSRLDKEEPFPLPTANLI